jgi:lipopolysaccharide export system protein LptA
MPRSHLPAAVLIVLAGLAAAGLSAIAAPNPKAKTGAAHHPAPLPPPPVAPPPPAPEPPHDEGTLEVTSDRDLEWLQQDHAYVARGNAVAKRGTVTLMGDTLIAYYRPIAGAAAKPKPAASTSQTGFDSGTTEIWRVVAEGNVHIISEDKDAWGDRAEYDKDKSVVVLTGKALKATTLEDTVTARDSLEYWQDKDMAVARGNAKVVKVNGNTLEGDVIGGHFVKDAHGTTALKTIESRGNVVVTTTSDVVHGDEGVYDLDTKRSVLFGNVRATHAASTIEGESAEVNMDTGISQVFPGLGQRVHGLFVRESTNPQGQPTTVVPGKH